LRRTHPAVYLVLIIPFGVTNGYVSVTLGYLLAHAGVSAQSVAALVAVYFVPQTWKFLWAPVADLTLTRKRWYLLSTALCMLGLIGLGAIAPQEKSLPLLSAVAFGASLATTFLAMSVESLMAYGTHEAERGRAGGWFQAGNLGGTGLGGGAGLWMAEHLTPPWMSPRCSAPYASRAARRSPSFPSRRRRHARRPSSAAFAKCCATCGRWRARGAAFSRS